MKTNTLTRSLIGMFVIACFCTGLAIGAGQDAPGLNRVPVLIGFKQVPGPAQQALVRSHNGVVKYSYHLVPAIAASIPEPAIEQLQRNPNVLYVEPDGMAYALVDTEELPWGVNRIDAELVHPLNKGTGVKVAIIDTGIDRDHPDLAANIHGGRRFLNAGSTVDDNYEDDHGHGTHCAGIVAAIDNDLGVIGVAPEAWLYAVKVLNSSGSGWWSDIVAGIQWATDNHVDVISMSLGGSTGMTTLENACIAANERGIVVVAAAGNSGNSAGAGDNVGYPARYESVIAVAATNSSDTRASFSSTGPDVEISAPGVSILSTYLGNWYAYMSGTSMACPHVAGTAALIIKSGITGVDAVRAKLQDTADDLGAAGRDPLYGFGLVDADEAAGTSSPANDPPTASFGYSTAGLTVTCTDTSTDFDGTIVAWSWSFGDGSTSTAQNPSHTYAAPGTYTVTLTVTDDDSATDTASASVTVSNPISNDPPIASFVYLVDGLTVMYIDISIDFDGSIVAWYWSFGDGSSSTAQNPSHTYAAPGTYTVTLTVMDDDGATDSYTDTVTVSAPLPPGTMHVGDIDAVSVKLSKGQWGAIVTIIIHDASHNGVEGATVSGIFSQRGAEVSKSGQTDSSGVCRINSGPLLGKGGTATFTVDDVIHDTLGYNSAGNHDPDGDSNGTTIVISK